MVVVGEEGVDVRVAAAAVFWRVGLVEEAVGGGGTVQIVVEKPTVAL